jgi:hypothetical protein
LFITGFGVIVCIFLAAETAQKFLAGLLDFLAFDNDFYAHGNASPRWYEISLRQRMVLLE